MSAADPVAAAELKTIRRFVVKTLNLLGEKHDAEREPTLLLTKKLADYAMRARTRARMNGDEELC